MDNVEFRVEKIIEMYENGHSPYEIAEIFETYPNKIRRLLKKYGTPLRDHSESQKAAIRTGRTEHPTAGKERDEETKKKIGMGQHKYWKKMSDQEYQKRVVQARIKWDNIPKETRELMRIRAQEAVRKAAKEGSKLEKYIGKKLEAAGYEVEYQKVNLIPNAKLKIDLFIPSIGVAIEIDGPTHFYPIYGQDRLDKVIKADSDKAGLLTYFDFVIIRVKCVVECMSNVFMEKVFTMIEQELEKIKKKRPRKQQGFIEIDPE